MRFHETTEKQRLVTHHDSENSSAETMSAVVTLSIVRSCRDEGTTSTFSNRGDDDDENSSTLVRLGATGTARSSIDNVYVREERDLPMADHIGNVFQNIDPGRRRVTKQLLGGQRVNFFLVYPWSEMTATSSQDPTISLSSTTSFFLPTSSICHILKLLLCIRQWSSFRTHHFSS